MIDRHGGGGGGCTVRETVTVCCVVPPLFVRVKVMVSVYVLALRLAIEGLMATLCEVPALKALFIGLMLSQLEPLAVDADHEPSAPQLVNVTVCGAGSACPWVPVKASEPGLELMHGGGGWTVSVTATVWRVPPELVIRAKSMLSL